MLLPIAISSLKPASRSIETAMAKLTSKQRAQWLRWRQRQRRHKAVLNREVNERKTSKVLKLEQAMIEALVAETAMLALH